MEARPRRIAILKERGPGEDRVIVVPGDLRHFGGLGLDVVVERGAGEAIGYDDARYVAEGASLVDPGGGWAAAPVVLKYKAPLADEYPLLVPGSHVGAIFHAEGDMELVRALCASGVHAYSYEFFQTADGTFPLAVPGGEIAGRMAIVYGAYFLQRQLGGAGLLLGAVPGAPRAKVVVIGYGNVGGSAARTAAALGAEVVVFGRRPHALRAFEGQVNHGLRVREVSREALAEELSGCHLLVGAILESTWDTPPLVEPDLVELMPDGAVIVDATAGYGPGYLPTFDRSTTFDEPIFERFGVLHCKLDALPKAVPVTAAHALSSSCSPYLARMARAALDESEPDPVSAQGLIVSEGRVVHPVVGRHVQLAGLDL